MMSVPRTWSRFIVHFANEHIEFRIPELESIVKSVETQIRYVTSYDSANPFLIVDLPSEACAKKISGRAVLVRSMYRYWCHAVDQPSALKQLRKLSPEFLGPFRRADATLKCVIDGYNRKVPHDEKMLKISTLMDILDSKGNVQLTEPEHRIHVLEYYTLYTGELKQVYIGNWIADGQRDLAKRYNLQERCFIGNTSMDPALSFIMANMANVKPGDLVIDPFVGTGSLLVSSAHHGAYVLGTDIDYLLLHARARPSRVGQKVRSKEESVRNNLNQYQMASQFLDVLIADSSRMDMFRDGLTFDAVVTDPPYGVRESSIKVGGDSEQLKDLSEAEKVKHIPGKEKYTLPDVFNDLMIFAAKFLRIGGRLVYWLPVNREKYDEQSIPQHPCLEVVANSEQSMTKRIGRRLITMEKVREYAGERAVENGEMKANLNSLRDDWFLPREKDASDRRARKCRKGVCEVADSSAEYSTTVR